MLRVRIGSSWMQDPALRTALGRGGSALVEAVVHGVDAIAIEVDGVDLCMGQAEGPVIGTLESLGEGLLRLLKAEHPRAHVSLAESDLELVVGRRGASALLSVVQLRRPARVVVRDVEVDLLDLARATSEAANALALELRSLHSSALDTLSESLASLVRRLDDAHPVFAHPAEGPIPTARAGPDRGSDPPLCAFELSGDRAAFGSYRGPGADLGSLLVPGRVELRAIDGRVIATAENAPFLVLRDLVAFAARVAGAVRGDGRASIELPAPGRNATVELHADVQAGTISRDAAPPFDCPPLLLARASCEAALELADRVLTQNPRQDRNGWLTTLRGDAAERLAQLDEILAGDLLSPYAGAVRRRRPRPLPGAPLGPGEVRRLKFRRAWSVAVGPPVAGALSQRDGFVVAAGSDAVLAIDARTGAERWRRGGTTSAWIGEGFFVEEAGKIIALDPATGRTRGGVDLSRVGDGPVRAVERIAGGVVLAVLPGALVALDPAFERVLWTFAPPAALTLRATGFGPLVLAASDTGLLYGLDAANGQQRWRLHLPGRLAAAPVSYGDRCLVVCETDLGGVLVALDPATGHRRFEVPLDGTPIGAPVPFAGLLGVPGSVAGDALVTAVDPAGTLAWEDAVAVGAGPIVLAALPSGLLAKTADGACAAVDRNGASLWGRPARTGHFAAANPAPVAARGVVLVASDQVEAIEARTGAPLGRAPLPGLVELLCDESLNAWGIDADGVLTAARLETHLSVVRSA